MLKKNDIITAEITALTNECAGVCKYDGMVIFVPFSAVGDVLSVRILKVKKTYAYGKIERIITHSPDRTENDCPVYGRCGGCSLRHITYEAELKAKEGFVRDAFTRIGGLTPRFLPIIPAPDTERYRNKLQMPVGKNGDDPVCGFYAFHSHRIVPCGDCLLQPVVFSEIVSYLMELVKEYGIPVYDEASKHGALRHIYLRKGHYSGEICLCIVSAKKLPQFYEIAEKVRRRFEDVKSVILNINPDDTNVILGEKEILLSGETQITDIMCGNRISISPKAFYQVNTPAAENLYAAAADFAQPDGKTVLDLYCGAGTIGLSMAKRAKKIIGVGIIPDAVENAKKNALANGIENAEFICADAGEAAKILREKGICPDVVIVDPPRKGCVGQTLKNIADFNAQRIVMVSCNPATAARDCAEFENLGYKTVSVVPVDMFSATAHVECVVLMSRD